MSPPQPAGIPLSRTLRILSQAHRMEFQATVRAIDSVHGCNWLPVVPILDADKKRVLSEGQYGCIEVDIYTKAPKRIFIDDKTLFPCMALLHEVGHLVDRALGADTFASTSGYLTKLLNAIYASDTMKLFRARRHSNKVPVPFMGGFPCPINIADVIYNASTREAFAHSYAWWIATICNEAVVQEEWKRYQQDTFAWISFPQWQTPQTDFDPIASEFEQVMRFEQWIQ